MRELIYWSTDLWFILSDYFDMNLIFDVHDDDIEIMSRWICY